MGKQCTGEPYSWNRIVDPLRDVLWDWPAAELRFRPSGESECHSWPHLCHQRPLYNSQCEINCRKPSVSGGHQRKSESTNEHSGVHSWISWKIQNASSAFLEEMSFSIVVYFTSKSFPRCFFTLCLSRGIVTIPRLLHARCSLTRTASAPRFPQCAYVWLHVRHSGSWNANFGAISCIPIRRNSTSFRILKPNSNVLASDVALGKWTVRQHRSPSRPDLCFVVERKWRCRL